jgi:HlyD family secretion protein
MAQQPEVDSAPQEVDSAPQSDAKPKKKPNPLILVIILAVVGVVIWRVFFAGPSVPPGIVALSGRIEGDDSAVAPKTTGRVLEVRVREGDQVNAGDVIAVLDDQQIKDRQDQAQAALTAAQARTAAATAEVAVLEQQLKQAQLTAIQSNDDAQGRVRQAEASLTAAEADLAQQEASLKLALFDKDAYTRLVQTGAVSERQGKVSVSTADQQEAAVTAARRRVEAARGALTTAKANLANPEIRASQVAGVRHQLIQQQAEIANSAASAEQARFQLAEADANRQDLIVRAPFAGTIVTRAAEPGEVITAGTAIVTLLDLNKVYLRGFVPEGEIGKVKVGQTAHVYLDSNPKEPLDAYVSRIDPQATFTPENTYFRDDRVKQVVGLKLQLKSGFGYAKPGMPSDGEVLVQGDAWPKGKVSR